MTVSEGSAASNADVATMLADMDSRLQELQRELAELPLTITRRGTPPRRGRRAVPTAASERPVAPGSPATRGSPDSEALVRDAILSAEQEARGIFEDAREQIAAVGEQTRVLLAQTLKTRPPPVPVTRPASSARAVEEHGSQGEVTVEAGPFGDVARLQGFEDTLASIPGVEDVYLRTFERSRAHFELRIAAG